MRNMMFASSLACRTRILGHVLVALLSISSFSAVESVNHPQSSKPPSTSSEVSMGTTLVALVYKHGVVVGADTRTSVSGYVSNRYAHKWTPIAQNILVGRSGSAADTQRLCENTRWELEALFYQHGRRKFSTSQVANLLRSQLRSDDWSASLLCVGVDDDDCIADMNEGKAAHAGKIYSLSSTGALLREDKYAVSGSGSTYILGHMDSLLSLKAPEEMEEGEAVRCVADAIQLAVDRDGSSGGMARIHVLNSDGRRSLNVYPTNNAMVHRSTGPARGDADGNNLPGFAPVKRETRDRNV